MAIYHCSVKIGSRANGQSAVASASYRSAEKLYSKAENRDFDYTRKQAVVYSEIMLPESAPKEYTDRATLWNAVEQSEKRTDAQLFREFEISLPNECTEQEKLEMTRSFAKSLKDEGMCVDFSIHDVKAGQYKTKGNIATNDNSHVHIMCTMRAIDENGKFLPKQKSAFRLDKAGEKIPVLDKAGKQKIRNGKKVWERENIKTTDWDSKEKIEEWRIRWEKTANRYLAAENRIDHRTLEEQTKDLEREMALVKRALELNERIEANERRRIASNDSPGGTETSRTTDNRTTHQQDRGTGQDDKIFRDTAELAQKKRAEAIKLEQERNRIKERERAIKERARTGEAGKEKNAISHTKSIGREYQTENTYYR